MGIDPISLLVEIALSVALSFVASLLAQKPNSVKPQNQSPTPTNNQVTVRQADASALVVYGRSQVAGVYANMAVTANNGVLHLAVMFAGHECDAIEGIWFDEELLTLDGDGNITGGTIEDPDSTDTGGKFAGHGKIVFHLGGPDQVADPDMVAALAPDWSATDTLSGICYAYVQLFWDSSVYGGGIPNITAIVRGKKVYDPVTTETAWSANAALCVADFLCDPLYGPGVVYSTGVDEEVLIVARNVCDEDVALAAGTTEKRFECHGNFSSSDSARDTLGKMLAAMQGMAVYDGVQWRITAAAWQEPDFTLTQDHLAGQVTIQALVGIPDNFNAVKGTYISALNQWQPADFPSLISNTFAAQDGGTAFTDITFQFVSSVTQCQRLAKIVLLKQRQQIQVTAECKLSAWAMLTGQTAMGTFPRYGWSEKNFDISGVSFEEGQDANNNPVPMITVGLRETDSSVYDWDTSEESAIDPAPNTNFPDVFNVLAPTNLTVAESKYSTNDGAGVKSKVTLGWSPSLDAFVASGGHYDVRWRISGTAAWTTAVTDQTSIDLLDLGSGFYDFQVLAVNYAGNPSAPLAAMQEIAGLSDTPSAPTNLQVTAAGMGTLAMLRWDLSPDLDVLQGGSIVFRFSSATSGATWATGVTIASPLPGNSVQAVLPLKSGTYMAKFVDSTGNWSDVTTVVSNQGAALDFTTLADAVESPAFAGTCQNCFVDGGVLKIAGADDFDAVPDVDALVSWDFAGGVLPAGPVVLGAFSVFGVFVLSGGPPPPPPPKAVLGDPALAIALGRPDGPSASYTFANKIDLGTITSCRLTSLIGSSVENVFDDFDSRSGNVDDWASWDGAVTGQEADAVLMVRVTNDDPADPGAVWSDWNRLDSAEYTARGAQARLDLYSWDKSYNIDVSQLAIVAEAPV